MYVAFLKDGKCLPSLGISFCVLWKASTSNRSYSKLERKLNRNKHSVLEFLPFSPEKALLAFWTSKLAKSKLKLL